MPFCNLFIGQPSYVQVEREQHALDNRQLHRWHAASAHSLLQDILWQQLLLFLWLVIKMPLLSGGLVPSQPGFNIHSCWYRKRHGFNIQSVVSQRTSGQNCWFPSVIGTLKLLLYMWACHSQH